MPAFRWLKLAADWNPEVLDVIMAATALILESF